MDLVQNLDVFTLCFFDTFYYKEKRKKDLKMEVVIIKIKDKGKSKRWKIRK